MACVDYGKPGHTEHSCAYCVNGYIMGGTLACQSCADWNTKHPQNLKWCQFETSDALHPTRRTDT